MGNHWITCPECDMMSGFPHDMMWFDEKGRLHDPNQWRCKKKDCGILFKKAEEKAFEKHMKEEQQKMRLKKSEHKVL